MNGTMTLPVCTDNLRALPAGATPVHFGPAFQPMFSE